MKSGNITITIHKNTYTQKFVITLLSARVRKDILAWIQQRISWNADLFLDETVILTADSPKGSFKCKFLRGRRKILQLIKFVWLPFFTLFTRCIFYSKEKKIRSYPFYESSWSLNVFSDLCITQITRKHTIPVCAVIGTCTVENTNLNSTRMCLDSIKPT